jgi:hypothetical protein
MKTMQYAVRGRAMTQAVSGLLSRRRPVLFHVVFVVFEESLVLSFLRFLRVFFVSIIPPSPSLLIYHLGMNMAVGVRSSET